MLHLFWHCGACITLWSRDSLEVVLFYNFKSGFCKWKWTEWEQDVTAWPALLFRRAPVVTGCVIGIFCVCGYVFKGLHVLRLMGNYLVTDI